MAQRQWSSLVAESFKFTEKGQAVEGKVETLLTKEISGDIVPACHLITTEGEFIEILMGGWAMAQLWENPSFQTGSYVCIRYDGESKTIHKAQNYAELFSVILYAPGTWKTHSDGSIEGDPVPLVDPTKAGKPSLNTSVDDRQWPGDAVSQEDGVFDPETPEKHGKRGKRAN